MEGEATQDAEAPQEENSIEKVHSVMEASTEGNSLTSEQSLKSIISELQEEEEEVKEEKESESEDIPHKVTISVTAAVAYAKPMDEHSRMLEEMVRRNKRTVEAPKPNHFLHCDYTIEPNGERTLTDVITYAVAAKVFTDADSRVVKTWEDGDQIWVAWIHSHEVEITKENVLSFYKHVVEMKVWDSREKVSTKARNDRPKAFRLPSTHEVNVPGKGVRGVVIKQSNSWTNLQPKDSIGEDDSEKGKKTVTLGLPTSDKELEVEDRRDEQPPERIRSTLGRLAGINAADEEKKRINELKRQQASLQKKLTKSGKKGENQGKSGKEKDKTRVNSQQSSTTAAKVKPASIQVKLEEFFAGTKAITSRINEPTGSIRDALMTVAVEGAFLPDYLLTSLNPMLINLKAVKHLPNTPLSRHQLEVVSHPIYCKYTFFGHPQHSTARRPHGKHVYFEDKRVFLLGELDEGQVREFIQSNSFEVEVHDRDQLDPSESGDAALFGTEKLDNKLANVGVVSAKRTAYNAFQSKDAPFDPFGIAHVSLIDLLRGRTSLSMEVAVTPCPLPEVLKYPDPNEGQEVRLVGVPGAVDRPQRKPQLAGHYIQAGTALKIKVNVARPLIPVQNIPRLLPVKNQMCLFSRVVYYFSYKNKELLRRLENFVTMTNATALGLHEFEKDVIEAALSTYKLTVEQKRSDTLDIITGFHVIDGNLHLMVLEGLREKAMKTLHNEVIKVKNDDDEILVHLYDSSLSFTSRLYSALDVDLCRVRLHQTLPEIMRQPLLYIRDMVPRECFDCLVKIYQITQTIRLRDAINTNLFPTAAMVISMSREFGIPLTYDDFENQHKPKVSIEGSPTELKNLENQNSPSREANLERKPPIDNHNPRYESILHERHYNPKDVNYVSSNVIAVQEAGKRQRPSHPSVRSLTSDHPPHNYSIQSLNSTEHAKNILRDMLRDTDPNGRYTYHPDYNSSMFTPVDVDAYHRGREEEEKAKWRTQSGFVYPGMHTSKENNEHPLKPEESRINDLKLAFRDNVLHRNILSPVLSRDRFKWENRKKDIDIYKRPPLDFGSSPAKSIHSAGDTKHKEEKQHKKEMEAKWRDKVVVDDTLMDFHRLLWATEASNDSNQLDQLTNLLKDDPKKLSLVRKPAPLIPPLNVVLNPSVDRAARERGVKLPPAFDESREKNVGFVPGPYENMRWSMDINRIPIKNEQHLKFAKKHGRDMNRYHKERKMLSKHLPVLPLSDEEKKTHLFRIPPIQVEEKEAPKTPPETENITEVMPERSMYRSMFPAHDVGLRIREIYPRHTFKGFAPLNKDGKPITRDASIHLVASGNSDQFEHAPFAHQPQDGVRPQPGEMLPNEASVELSLLSSTPKPSLEVS